MEYRKILMAVDRSSKSSEIFEDSLALAQKGYVQLRLLHRLEPETVA